jgi:transposase
VADDPTRPSYEDLAVLVAAQAATIERLENELVELRARADEVDRLRLRVAELERQLGQNSGNSGKPSSRDPVAERQRQAEQRAKRGGTKRRRGKQHGSKGQTLEMSATPDEIIDHVPERCEGCGAGLDHSADEGYSARQVVDVPEIRPTVTEHRAHTYGCSCGHHTTAAFPEVARAPVSYGPRVRAIVAYLLARQHIPNRRVAEAMTDLFGVKISTGAIDGIYAEAARRLKGFIAALVVLLRSLPVIHADETTDRVGTKNCWMHVASTGLHTLIHASMTRGTEAIEQAGVLIGYRGVVIHDRLALYWKLKAKHGLCAAHLLRDLADAATVATQTAWAAGLAALLVEINTACEQARLRGLKTVAPALKRSLAARYDDLVAQGQAANPEPAGRPRNYLERRSNNLVTAFATHRTSILRYMHDLDVAFTNNQAERDLRPTKLHRKISGCFRSQAGAQRFAHLRSYLSTTRKNGVTAIDALTRLFEGDPWMPPQPT